MLKSTYVVEQLLCTIKQLAHCISLACESQFGFRLMLFKWCQCVLLTFLNISKFLRMPNKIYPLGVKCANSLMVHGSITRNTWEGEKDLFPTNWLRSHKWKQIIAVEITWWTWGQIAKSDNSAQILEWCLHNSFNFIASGPKIGFLRASLGNCVCYF